MAEFRFVNDFQMFAAFVKRKGRYNLDTKNQFFLKAVLETCRERVIKKDAVLWRAQRGHDSLAKPNFLGLELTVEAPHKPERMKPLLDRANEGRINPKGIPYLYLSTEKSTAMSEVRPWMGAYISVAEFVVLRDLRLVDCSSETDRPVGDDPPKWAWWNINAAFSEPVNRSDEVADYAPTQVLAEAFRNVGYDGIVYGSKLGSGENVALFDLTAADPTNCRLFQVETVRLTFSETLNP